MSARLSGATLRRYLRHGAYALVFSPRAGETMASLASVWTIDDYHADYDVRGSIIGVEINLVTREEANNRPLVEGLVSAIGTLESTSECGLVAALGKWAVYMTAMVCVSASLDLEVSTPDQIEARLSLWNDGSGFIANSFESMAASGPRAGRNRAARRRRTAGHAQRKPRPKRGSRT